MREILFRAWDNKRNEWYGESEPDMPTFYEFSLFGECMLCCFPKLEDLQHLVIEQMVHKHKEFIVYEGDKIKFTHVDNIYEGVWDEIQECVVGSFGKVQGEFGDFTSWYIDFMIEADYEVEVVGNIHQTETK